MRFAIIILSLIMIFITVLSQKVNIRIIIDPRLHITFELTLFAIELTPSKKKKQKKKRSGKLNAIKLFNRSRSALRYLIKRSEVRINALTVAKAPTNPLSYLGLTPKIITASVFVSYLKANAKSIVYNNEADGFITSKQEINAPNIDFIVSFSLVYLFISLLIVAYYTIKSYAKLRKRNRIG